MAEQAVTSLGPCSGLRAAHQTELCSHHTPAPSPPPRRVAKAVEAAFAELSVPLPPRFNSRAVTGAYLALRGEVLHLVELRRLQAARQAAQRVDTKRKTPGEGQAAVKRQKVASKR